MFDFTQIRLEDINVHRVGNKGLGEELSLSQKSLQLDDQVRTLLQQYFLHPFKDRGLYQFDSKEGLENNRVFQLVRDIFLDPDSVHLRSVELAQRLYELADHPRIKAGEFYATYFEQCQYQDEIGPAVGLFKSESKETYLKVFPQGDGFDITAEEGLNLYKLDKGCLVFNTDEDSGYKVAVVDNTNHTPAARYWQTDFLGLVPTTDEYQQTRQYLDLSRGFVSDVPAGRVEQIGLMEETLDYFNNNDTFNQVEYCEKVLQKPELIDAFEDYRDQYQNQNEVELPDNFQISAPAYQQSRRFIRPVIKLDKNFHIYVHGNRQNIVRDYDEQRELYYYKLFFQEEF